MLREIYRGVFAAFLLICLCHSSRINAPLDKKSNDTDSIVVTSNREENGRCFGWIKKWFGFKDDEEVVSGDPNDVKFYLYSNPFDKEYVEEIRFGDVNSLRSIHFRSGQPLKVVVHGFTKNYVSHSMQLIKDAYLERMAINTRNQDSSIGYNVVLVDWEPLGNPNASASSLYYKAAVRNVPVVGKRVGEFVQFLLQNGVIRSMNDVHLIGFSLGAHVVGGAGNTLRQIVGDIPSRVTGLDPAGPQFYKEIFFPSRHLDKTDGKFVDIIHSNYGGLGTIVELGHADFYPNGGGPNQQACVREYELKQSQPGSSDGGIWDAKALFVSSCSHNKAPEFFAMSILNTNIIACRCESYKHFLNTCTCQETAIFGEYCDPRTRGRFYFNL